MSRQHLENGASAAATSAPPTRSSTCGAPPCSATLSQRPTGQLGRLARPGERAGHQVSTAHFQAAYPAVAEAGLGARGVYIGADLHGGSFVYDPWLLYGRGGAVDREHDRARECPTSARAR